MKSAFLASAFSCLLTTSASAAVYGFAFVDTTADLDAYGELTTSNTLDSLGGYDVTGISGFIDGKAITSLVANPDPPNTAYHYFNDPNGDYFYYDNVLYSPGAPHVDVGGILVTVGSKYYNIYNDTGVIGQDTLDLYNGSGFTGTSGIFGISEIAVPEPATWAAMLLGFAGAGTMIRQRRKRLAAIA
jgi:hypothetical protein